MILEYDQIAQLIRSQEPEFIKKAKIKQKQLDVHVNGIGLDEYLKQIDTYENEGQFKLRKQVATSLKFMMSNILRPMDKIWSAKGGSREFEITGNTVKKDFMIRLGNLNYGLSTRRFIQKVVAPKFISDPSGFVLIEWDGENAKPEQYSIQDVHCYKTNGRSLEFILFKGEKRKKSSGENYDGTFFRFIDDEKDVTMYRVDEESINVFIDENGNEELFDNPWGKVPAIVNSDLFSDCLRYSESPIDKIMELADKYLRTFTIKNVHEFLHGFPFFWMYAKKCDTCKGEGFVPDREGSNRVMCSKCDGTGKMMKKDVSDVMLLNAPTNKDQPVIAPDVAGYTTPPLEIPKEQREELDWLESLMTFTMWGTQTERTKQGVGNETATGRFIDVDPVINKLTEYSETFEELENKVIKLVGQYELGTAFKSVGVSYGNRFHLEPVDKIYERYQTARVKGAPDSILDKFLIEYLETEYRNNPRELSHMIKAMQVEPLIHRSISNMPQVDAQTLLRKTYFNEYWVTIKSDDKSRLSVEQLKDGLDDWIRENVQQNASNEATPPDEE